MYRLNIQCLKYIFFIFRNGSSFRTGTANLEPKLVANCITKPKVKRVPYFKTRRMGAITLKPCIIMRITMFSQLNVFQRLGHIKALSPERKPVLSHSVKQ